ncbi:hypothetical protein FLM48_11100 [Shewanella sp. Scap07]|uniref:hypothetical protein n=1 Tax=Shewanella sp. Scap07 TaxID=2589987 RepID=UPI0015BB92D5|nr:hypothetical protein [Shewanella sp. Scap07]QLE85576.1 hypothetical protein FLM48_11100 [Shewanella sp. Scap07]
MNNVAVLFARADSIYKSFSGCDVYDINRDALNFNGGLPVVGHPPCRAWGKLRHFAKPVEGEKELAFFCVDQIRLNGGVLEHPKHSKLWDEYNLPNGTEVDEYGGFSLNVDQFWWGHKARKETKLYICGVNRRDIPQMPLVIGEPEYVCSMSKAKHRPVKKEISKADREHTPPEFAAWLIQLAKKCVAPGQKGAA